MIDYLILSSLFLLPNFSVYLNFRRVETEFRRVLYHKVSILSRKISVWSVCPFLRTINTYIHKTIQAAAIVKALSGRVSVYICRFAIWKRFHKWTIKQQWKHFHKILLDKGGFLCYNKVRTYIMKTFSWKTNENESLKFFLT